MTCYAQVPLIMQYFIVLGQTMCEKSVTKKLHLSIFWKICAPRKNKPKFTKFGEQDCPLARPLTLSNFVALGQELCEIYCPKFVRPKSGPKFTKMIYYAQMPLIVPNFIALDQTMYEKSVTKISYTFSILALRGTLCATVLALLYSKAPGMDVPNFVSF